MAYYNTQDSTEPRRAVPRTTAQPAAQTYAQPAAQPAQTYSQPATQPQAGQQNWGNYNPTYQGGQNPYGSGGYVPPPPTNYAQPQQTGGIGQYGSSLEGFDSGKLSDPTHDTAKYSFARLASNYAPTAQGFSQLIADPGFQGLGFQSVGNGNIRLPNGEVVDVVRGFQQGGQAWQWGTSGAVESGQAQGLPQDYGASMGQQPQQQQASPEAWQQYYAALADWQARYGQPQQAAQQAPQAQPVAEPVQQAWAAPSVPQGAVAYPQGGYQQDYPSYKYNPGYTTVEGGYMPDPSLQQAQNYMTPWVSMPRQIDPMAQAFQYLGQGMFPGSGY